jgi:uncharacterized protein (DUF2267 family)
MPAFQGLPGTIAPDELHGRDEWVPAGRDFVRSLAVRLGSETSVEKIVLATLPPLASHLAPDSWAAVLDELPWELRPMVKAASAHLGGPVPQLATRDAYVAFVARHAQHPDARAALYVGSVLGALKEAAPAGLAAAILAELPSEIAALWEAAR